MQLVLFLKSQHNKKINCTILSPHRPYIHRHIGFISKETLCVAYFPFFSLIPTYYTHCVYFFRQKGNKVYVKGNYRFKHTQVGTISNTIKLVICQELLLFCGYTYHRVYFFLLFFHFVHRRVHYCVVVYFISVSLFVE